MAAFAKLCAAGALGAGVGYAVNATFYTSEAEPRLPNTRIQPVSILGAIGNTPLIEIESLSRATGCKIVAKAEHLNPGGSVKDRAALWLVEDAENSGRLRPGGTVVEGTGGNTGIGLALVAAAKGYKGIFTMPESIAVEKIDLMKVLGAEVILCPPVPFTDERHYFHQANKIAERDNHVCTSQFENVANAQAHYESTGPELFAQTSGNIDAFVCAAGTGGTIGGMSRYLKEKKPDCKVYLIDPEGSGLLDAVTKDLAGGDHGVPSTAVGNPVTLYARSPGGSISEGIGTDRKTANFALAIDGKNLDGVITGTDQEVVDMAYHLLREDGIFMGPSAAFNVLGAYKLAKELGPGHTICTVICDGGDRYRSKLYSETWLKSKNLAPKPFLPSN